MDDHELRCHCGHLDRIHEGTAPYRCKSCPCPAYRWDQISRATWDFWSRQPEGRPEWATPPGEEVA